MSDNQEVKAVTVDPLNPPEGIVCIAVIHTIRNGEPYIDVQGHINNEQAAITLLTMAIEEVKNFHTQKRMKENSNGI